MKNTNTISHIKHGALMALCLYLLSTLGCEVRPDSKLPEINDFIVDSVYLPITEMDGTKGRIREVGHGKFAPNEWIAFMKNNSMKLYFFDMVRQTYIDSISLVSYWNENPDFETTGVDSVYLNLNNNKLTRLFGNDKKEWHLNAITAAIGPKVYIGTVSAYPIVTFGDTVICTTTTSEGKKNSRPEHRLSQG